MDMLGTLWVIVKVLIYFAILLVLGICQILSYDKCLSSNYPTHVRDEAFWRVFAMPAFIVLVLLALTATVSLGSLAIGYLHPAWAISPRNVLRADWAVLV